MKLLLDIGNTRIKWCRDNNGNLNTAIAVDYKQRDFLHDLRVQWLTLDPPSQLAISSVSEGQTVEQIIDLAMIIWPDIEIIMAKSQAKGFSVINAYQQPGKLGVDRWLGLIALRKFYPGESCIIDCGTAITLDCLNSHGQHLGGLISPGLRLMKQSLYQGAENLSFSNKQYTTGLSRSTEAAIYTGTLYAAAGLIEKTINNLCSCNRVVMTGGDAELLEKYLEFKSIIDSDIILKGLSLFCEGSKV
jgi:type III pantothenate kinase